MNEFRAYYYGFDATGNEDIDKILAMVARAGKMFHSTEFWNDEEEWIGEESVADAIQNAANQAAKNIKTNNDKR